MENEIHVKAIVNIPILMKKATLARYIGITAPVIELLVKRGNGFPKGVKAFASVPRIAFATLTTGCFSSPVRKTQEGLSFFRFSGHGKDRYKASCRAFSEGTCLPSQAFKYVRALLEAVERFRDKNHCVGACENQFEEEVSESQEIWLTLEDVKQMGGNSNNSYALIKKAANEPAQY